MNLNTIQVGILSMLNANGAMHDLDLFDAVREHLHEYSTHISIQTLVTECELLVSINKIIAVKYRREDIEEFQNSRYVYFPGDCNIRVENYR